MDDKLDPEWQEYDRKWHEEWKQKRCSDENGCVLAYRGPRPYDPHMETEMVLYEDDPEHGIREEDPNYEYESDSEDEILEYQSECSDEDMEEAVGFPEEENGAAIDPTDIPEWTFRVLGPEPPPIQDEFWPLSTVYVPDEELDEDGEIPSSANRKAEEYEHIAGPTCKYTRAYHGSRVSVEEMRGCEVVQCILPKDHKWRPRQDDVDFEHHAQYFLTGISDRMAGDGYPILAAPVRHGADHINAQVEFFWTPVSLPLLLF